MAIDTGKTKDSLFGGLKKAAQNKATSPAAPNLKMTVQNDLPLEIQDDPCLSIQPKTTDEAFSSKAKWETLDSVLTLLRSDQKEGLDKVAKKIMKYRSNVTRGRKDKERITTNTVLRAIIDNFLEFEKNLPLEVLTSEEDVLIWIRKLFIQDFGNY